MTRRKSSFAVLTLFSLILGYLVFAFRAFFLAPELEYEVDVPQEARPIIKSWYDQSKYKTPVEIKSDDFMEMLINPLKERSTISVHYGIMPSNMPSNVELIALDIHWKPWGSTVFFSNESGEWRLVNEFVHTQQK